jgi:hypothetical protein
MKKFLSYSLIATVLIVVIGVLFIFGTFDLNLGQTNTANSGQTSVNTVKIHNEIVDIIQDLAILSLNINDSYNELNPESDLNDLRNLIQTIKNKKNRLKSIVPNDAVGVDIFENEYLPALETFCNSYLKAINYFEEKEYTQESIDSFKNILNESEQKLKEVHNHFVEELNSHKH